MSERFPHQFLRHKRARDLESTTLNPSNAALFAASLNRAIQERTSSVRYPANSGKILLRPPITATHDAIHTDVVFFP